MAQVLGHLSHTLENSLEFQIASTGVSPAKTIVASVRIEPADGKFSLSLSLQLFFLNTQKSEKVN